MLTAFLIVIIVLLAYLIWKVEKLPRKIRNVRPKPKPSDYPKTGVSAFKVPIPLVRGDGTVVARGEDHVLSDSEGRIRRGWLSIKGKATFRTPDENTAIAAMDSFLQEHLGGEPNEELLDTLMAEPPNHYCEIHDLVASRDAEKEPK